jgi:kynurenine 3-monooxygenase
LRASFQSQLHGFQQTQDYLDHGYKELLIPAAADGSFALHEQALHIWPRQSFMLIALPNLDHSFTCTLFMPYQGNNSFAELQTPEQVTNFFQEHFADAAALMPTLAHDFAQNPTGSMVTVRCAPWHIAGRAMLLGDAAHAIVPFFGQGMNCGFEDCTALANLLDSGIHDWATLFSQLNTQRKPNADAIADLALENFTEMRDTVADPKFQLKKQVGFELERRHPAQFIPRYAMVVFRPDISYADAQRRGLAQDKLLDLLTACADSLDEIDWQHAEMLLHPLG